MHNTSNQQMDAHAQEMIAEIANNVG